MHSASTVALVEFNWAGHHPTHFRFYCEGLLNLGSHVIALCPQPQEVLAWSSSWPGEWRDRLEVGQIDDEVQHLRWTRKLPPLANAYRFKQTARCLATRQAGRPAARKVDLVFFACLFSGTAPSPGWVARAFPYRWAGLLIDSGQVRMDILPRTVAYRTFDPLTAFRAVNCVALCTHDEFLAPLVRSPLVRQRLLLVPEVADLSPPRPDSPLVARLLEAAGDRPIIGCFGQFARRKGAMEFLRTAQLCRDDHLFFAWAGPMEAGSFRPRELRWIEEFLAQPPTNCLVEFGRVPDGADFNALIVASRVLFLCYHRFFNASNLLTKAAYFQKPSLVSAGRTCMADQTREYGMGECVPEVFDPNACRTGLHRLLASGVPRGGPRYLAVHSAERLIPALQSLLERCKAVT